jgi:hypothetical protein
MPTSRSPLRLTNLLNDLDTVCQLLVDRIGSGDILNSYLLAAGAQQIVDDHLHRDPLLLRRAASRIEHKLPSRWGLMSASCLRMTGSLVWRAATSGPGDRNAAAWRLDLDVLIGQLAARILESSSQETLDPGLVAGARALAASTNALPISLRHEWWRLPSCFRSFDQAPEDVAKLADGFANSWPHRERPLTVVGIRSSGSYLAPLLASRLRWLAYNDVAVATMRPGQQWLDEEVRGLRWRSGRSGMAIAHR